MKYSTHSKIHKRISAFVEWIAPDPLKEDSTKAQADEIRNRISTQAEADGYTISAMPYSGSFGKKTGLRRHLMGDAEVEGQDIDLGFIMKDSDANGNKLGCLVPDFKAYLKHSYPNSNIGETKSSATISFTGTKLQYDLVPLIETSDPKIQKLIRTDGKERTSSVQKHKEFVKSRNRSSNAKSGRVKFNECLRLLKWWRYERQRESGIFGNGPTDDHVPSILIDLLCAKAYDEMSVGKTYAETLMGWFGFLANVVRQRKDVVFTDFVDSPNSSSEAEWKVIDPVDDQNNIAENWASYEIDELAEWFEAARGDMASAERWDEEGKDAKSLGFLVSLFGKSFKNNCND